LPAKENAVSAIKLEGSEASQKAAGDAVKDVTQSRASGQPSIVIAEQMTADEARQVIRRAPSRFRTAMRCECSAARDISSGRLNSDGCAVTQLSHLKALPNTWWRDLATETDEVGALSVLIESEPKLYILDLFSSHEPAFISLENAMARRSVRTTSRFGWMSHLLCYCHASLIDSAA
jgi:hypothetical protein